MFFLNYDLLWSIMAFFFIYDFEDLGTGFFLWTGTFVCFVAPVAMVVITYTWWLGLVHLLLKSCAISVWRVFYWGQPDHVGSSTVWSRNHFEHRFRALFLIKRSISLSGILPFPRCDRHRTFTLVNNMWNPIIYTLFHVKGILDDSWVPFRLYIFLVLLVDGVLLLQQGDITVLGWPHASDHFH